MSQHRRIYEGRNDYIYPLPPNREQDGGRRYVAAVDRNWTKLGKGQPETLLDGCRMVVGDAVSTAATADNQSCHGGRAVMVAGDRNYDQLITHLMDAPYPPIGTAGSSTIGVPAR